MGRAWQELAQGQGRLALGASLRAWVGLIPEPRGLASDRPPLAKTRLAPAVIQFGPAPTMIPCYLPS
jgi:hypothetical protein